MYSSWLIYAKDLGEKCEFKIPSLSIDQDYYFSIESFNTAGISEPSDPTKTE